MSIRMHGMQESLGNGRFTSFDGWEFGEAPKDDDKILLSLGTRAMFLMREGEFKHAPNAMYHATFIEQEDFGYGREDSKHVARFGQMILNGGGIHEGSDLVALKTYDNPADLRNEWAASMYANGQFDIQRAFLPLGVFKENQEDGEVGMVSLYENSVHTADEKFWADIDLEPEALRPEVIEETAVTCMRGLGLMHGSRIIHNDAQVKNLGRDNRNIRFIDLEDAELVPEDATDSSEVAKKVMRDIAMFIGSTTQVEENVDRIASVLARPEVVDAMMQGYRDGLEKARTVQVQKGIHIPDYASMHEDQIRSTIDKTIGIDKRAA